MVRSDRQLAPRVQFLQQGLPRNVARQNGFEFAGRMNPDSPMTMGFVDQQVNSSGPAPVVTFAGNSSARLTSAKTGDYFDNGSIAHFSHVIQDLFAFFASTAQEPAATDAGEPFTERVQYMFRSNQTGTPNGIPAAGNSDQFTNGGGPAFVNNVFQGSGSALAAARDSAGQFTPANATQNATFTGLPRIGHESALQQVSRAADGTPLHVRMDGPGFDGMDVPAFNTAGKANLVSDGVFAAPGTSVPAGSHQFKLQFVPTAQLFSSMRNAAAAQRLARQFNVAPATMAWSGSSLPPGGRISLSRPAATAPSRSSSSASHRGTRTLHPDWERGGRRPRPAASSDRSPGSTTAGRSFGVAPRPVPRTLAQSRQAGSAVQGRQA